MTKVLLLPGLFGSDNGHWQDYWRQDDADSVWCHQDDWHRPQLSEWMRRLEQTLEREGPCYLVAHSLGCVLTAHLASCTSARNVLGALLVAPCDLPVAERLHPATIGFGTMPTARLPFPSVVVGSLNDRYMAIDRLSYLARLWGSEMRNLGMAGHINIDSGFGRWPGGYRLLDLLRKKTPRKISLGQARKMPMVQFPMA